MIIKNLSSVIAIFVVCLSHAQYTDDINSNRPGESQGAFSVGKYVSQIEFGIIGIDEKHALLFTQAQGVYADLNMRFGFIKEELELNLQVVYQADLYTTILGSENRSALKKSIIGAKYLFYDPYKYRNDKPNLYSWKANNKFKWNQFIPAVAVYAGANLNFSDSFAFKNEPVISPKLILIAQNQFSSGFVLVTNIIADKFTTEFPSYGYIVTLTKGIGNRWSGFVENQGYMSDLYADSIVRGGATFLLSSDMQIDASLSTNFKNTPTILYGGMGVSWRFDKLHKVAKIKDRSGKKTKKSAQAFISKSL